MKQNGKRIARSISMDKIEIKGKIKNFRWWKIWKVWKSKGIEVLFEHKKEKKNRTVENINFEYLCHLIYRNYSC